MSRPENSSRGAGYAADHCGGGGVATRKEAVPRAGDVAHLAPRSGRNFVAANRMQASGAGASVSVGVVKNRRTFFGKIILRVFFVLFCGAFFFFCFPFSFSCCSYLFFLRLAAGIFCQVLLARFIATMVGESKLTKHLLTVLGVPVFFFFHEGSFHFCHFAAAVGPGCRDDDRDFRDTFFFFF